ncbi:MFS transporter [Ramlibacter tataouinensis]|uniref:MFS transporter n=1 Tax=Ramlibacter tataouinensis TaxID=94132 RepID=UPI0022F3A135|nr:MFS transporter [Ramlibacter tataouinensis]WBY02128.1 MFS transporter [Ramlibacter tataouinensis]
MTAPGAAAATAGRAAPAPVLWALLFGNFVIGAGVMVVAGTLNEISDSLQVPVATAGQLITVGGVVMCLGAPLLAAVVAGWDRRRLLALVLLWYALLHLACALAPGFGALLSLRALAVVAPAIFTPQAAACVGLLVPAHERGRAITFVFLGWSLASVLGMPMGAFIGGVLGWQAAFGAVAVLAMVGAAWVWRSMPDGVRPPALSARAWADTLGSRPLMLCIAVTVLYSAGQFVLFSYLAPYFRHALGTGPTAISLMFMWFGLFGFIGNVLMSRNVDRVGAARSVGIGIGLMVASFALWPLGTSVLAMALVVVPWALGCFASNSAQQARLVGLAPGLAAGSIALNSSAMYAGQAIGAAGGGWLMLHSGFGLLHWAGLASLIAALGLSMLATRATRTARG